MKEIEYRIIKEFDGRGKAIYQSQYKHSFWPWWLSCSNGWWKCSEDEAKHDIVAHRRKRKQKIIYQGSGKDLEFVESL